MSADSERPFAIGDVLAGKYRIERVLGEGGMGVVVAATHLQLEQLVAMKFVLPSMLSSSTVVERFLREARAAVRLKSEHVAKVLDVGTLETGAPYMVMEYLEGADLGEVQAEHGPLPPAMACDYLVQACEAVAEAHSLGIVHRDLKPQNLFLTKSVGGAALVKVLDFGISKVASEIGSGLTATQSTIGSPLYMAPEQMRSAKSVDGRADIWALGVVLYKLLSGEVPFEADTMPALCYKVVHDPPRPLHEVQPGVQPGLAAIVTRCLEKDPDRRFQNVGELASALEAYAPASVYASAERARSVSRGTRGSLPVIAEPTLDVVGPMPVPALTPQSLPIHGTLPIPTMSSWGDTKGGAKSSRRRSGMLIGALALLIGATAAFIALRPGGHGPSPALHDSTSGAAGPAVSTMPYPSTEHPAIAAPSALVTAAPLPAPPPPSAEPLGSASAAILPKAAPPSSARPPKPGGAPPGNGAVKPAGKPSGSPDDEIPSMR